jgi:hypothetical protein
MDENEAIFKRVPDDDDSRDALATFYLQKVYERLREGKRCGGGAAFNLCRPAR